MTDRLAAAVAELVAALGAELAAATVAAPDRLLDLVDVAERLGCTRQTLYRRDVMAALRPVHVGRRVKVAESAVNAYIRGQSPPEPGK
ncbi:MAG: helix-turn-helix domain-containing protein [Candidatus Limnocylindrales bacterium]